MLTANHSLKQISCFAFINGAPVNAKPEYANPVFNVDRASVLENHRCQALCASRSWWLLGSPLELP